MRVTSSGVVRSEIERKWRGANGEVLGCAGEGIDVDEEREGVVV